MSELIVPPFLKPGDKVAVVAPAGKVEEPQLIKAFEVITSWKWIIVTGRYLFHNHGYFSGTDNQRLHDLQEMIDDPSIKAIFCVRGGYGLTRIIDNVKLDNLIRNPKWIIGFSDVTALHLKLSHYGIQSIHGIMPIHFDPARVQGSLDKLFSFLTGNLNIIEWTAHKHNRTGEASGYLRGGNLSLLADSMGTSTELIGTDTILFMEEIDEYLYKIDRMLVQLQRAGIFEKIKGLLVGHFSSVKDTKVPFGKSLEEVILEKVNDYNIPVAFGLQSGHDFPNLPIPHNRMASLSVNDRNVCLKF